MRFVPKGCTLLEVEEATRRLGDRSIFTLGDSLTAHLSHSLRWLRRRALLETMCSFDPDPYRVTSLVTVSDLRSWLPWVRDKESRSEWVGCAWQPTTKRDRAIEPPMLKSGCGVAFQSIGAPWGPDVNFSATFAPIEARTTVGTVEVLLLNLGVWYNCHEEFCAQDADAVIEALRSVPMEDLDNSGMGVQSSGSTPQRLLTTLA